MSAGILIILAIIFGIQCMMPKARLGKFELFGILSLMAALGFIFGFAIYRSFLQYQFWKSNELTKFFLPPYQNFDYFVFYARTIFFNSYLTSLFIGSLFLWAAKYFNKKYAERFFEPIEPYFLAISIFLIGHPGWLFYLIMLLSVFLAINIFITSYHLFFFKHKEILRISLYYFWLPAAISTILISKWIEALPWWKMLKF